MGVLGWYTHVLLMISLPSPCRFRVSRLLVGVVLVHGLLCASVAGQEGPSDHIVVGIQADNFPYAYVNAWGEAAGFEVELLRLVGREAKLRFDFRAVREWESEPLSVPDAIDILAGVLVEDDRPRVAALSAPYLSQPYAMFVREAAEGVDGLDEMVGKRLAVIDRPPMHHYIETLDLRLLVTYERNAAEALEALSREEYDAVVLPRLQGQALAAQRGIAGIEARGGPLFYLDFALAVDQDNTELLAALNPALAGIRQTGAYDRVYEKWFEQTQPVATLIIPMDKAKQAAGAMAALLLILALWLLILRRKVRLNTRALEQQLAELRRTDAALRENENRMRTIVQSMPVMLVAFDNEGRIVAWNRECEQVTGYRTDEIVEHADALGLLFPNKQDRHRVYREWAAQTEDYREWECRLACKGGSARQISWSSIASRFSIPGWATWAVGVDITNRNRAEAELRTSEELNRWIIEAVPGGIVHVSPQGRVYRANELAQEFLGLTHDPLTGRLVDNDEVQTLYEDGTPCSEEDYPANKCLRTGMPQAPETLGIKRPDGSIGWGIFSAVPMLDPHSRESLGAVVTFLDITARKEAEESRRRLEEQLRQSQKMEAIGQLAGGVAHDFNNILTAILGNAELAQDVVGHESIEPDDVDEVRTSLQQIERSAERAARLTRQLLTFGRKQTGHPEIVELNQLIQDLDKMLGRLIGAHIRIRLELAADLARVRVDLGQMEQVIMNLSLNARDAMPEGGELIIRTYNQTVSPDDGAAPVSLEPGSYVVLSVKDTGVGMDEETLKRLFEPFYTTKPVGKGTGLGLSTVYGIVTTAGGAIGVESLPASASTFYVYIPATDEPVAVKPERKLIGELGAGQRILLCEDEVEVRRLLRRCLENAGYVVTEAVNGRAAHEIAQQTDPPFDLLITDLIMPELNGRDLSQQLRERFPDMAILMISGYASEMIDESELAAKRTAFLQKPFQPDDVLYHVRELLN